MPGTLDKLTADDNRAVKKGRKELWKVPANINIWNYSLYPCFVKTILETSLKYILLLFFNSSCLFSGRLIYFFLFAMSMTAKRKKRNKIIEFRKWSWEVTMTIGMKHATFLNKQQSSYFTQICVFLLLQFIFRNHSASHNVNECFPYKQWLWLRVPLV